jgi:hypothetical protein
MSPVGNCVYVSIITNVCESLSLYPEIFNVNKIRLCKFSPTMKDNETMLLIITTCGIYTWKCRQQNFAFYYSCISVRAWTKHAKYTSYTRNATDQLWIHSSCSYHWHKTYSIKNLFSRKNSFINLLRTHIPPEMHTAVFTYKYSAMYLYHSCLKQEINCFPSHPQ